MGAASQENLGSVQEPQGWEGTCSSQGDGATGQPSRRALLQGRQAGEKEHGSGAAQCSQGRTAPADFILSSSFKAEMSCSSCPGAVYTGDTTFMKHHPLAAAAAVCASVLHFHSLIIPLLSLQTPYPEREDKCAGVRYFNIYIYVYIYEWDITHMLGPVSS